MTDRLNLALLFEVRAKTVMRHALTTGEQAAFSYVAEAVTVAAALRCLAGAGN